MTKKQIEMVETWIQEMAEAGYTPEEMILILKEARRQYENFKNKQQNKEKALLPDKQGS